MALKMRTSSLQFKMLVITGTALAIALAASVFALSRVYDSIQVLDRLTREDFQSHIAIVQTRTLYLHQVQEWKNVLLRGSDAAKFETHWQGFEKFEKDAAATAREARAGLRDPGAIAKLEQFLTGHKAAGAKYREGLEAFRQFGNDPWTGDRAVAGVDEPLIKLLQEAEQSAQDSGTKATMEAVKSADRGYWLAIGGTAAAMLAVMIAIALFLRRSVVAPIQEAMRFAGRIEQGDLTAEIHGKTRDEIGQLMHSLQKMKNALGGVVAQVRTSADSVVVAAGQVSMGTTDLSQRTEEQASSLEETAASMEELASTVKQNADNAKQADALARGAAKRAEQGGSEVVQVVTTMTEISGSAKRIADIISVIDGIAFQTNILALNAAVEAARAGEQGRGFAVVAAEVRSLAQRSAQAAKEIKTLIGAAVEATRIGTRRVDESGRAMDEIMDSVQGVAAIFNEILSASDEQKNGIEQVERAVTQMDRATQENAALVGEVAASAQSLEQQAERLAELVARFRLRGEASAPAQAVEEDPWAAPEPPKPAGFASVQERRAVPRLTVAE